MTQESNSQEPNNIISLIDSIENDCCKGNLIKPPEPFERFDTVENHQNNWENYRYECPPIVENWGISMGVSIVCYTTYSLYYSFDQIYRYDKCSNHNKNWDDYKEIIAQKDPRGEYFIAFSFQFGQFGEEYGTKIIIFF